MKTKYVALTALAIFALALTACKDEPDNKDSKKDTVQREFKITFNYYKTLSGTLTPYPVTVTVIDETNGATSLEEQGIVSKLIQAFEAFAEMAEGNAMGMLRANDVFSRKLIIIVRNSGEFYEGFKAINYNTVRCLEEFIKMPNPSFSIADYLNDVIIFNLYPLSA